MSTRLHYSFGRIDSILADGQCDLGRKVLAVIFHADPDFSIRTLNGLVKNDKVSERWRSRLRILLSGLLLTQGELASAKQQISLVSPKLEAAQPDQWRPFYSSTGNYLSQLYKQITDLPLATAGDRINTAVVGDSHVLGIAAASSKVLEKIYLPTVTLRLLSSPQDNALKVAMKNAANLTYRLDRVVFSVGEIDSRGFASLINKDPSFWQSEKPRWKGAVSAAYGFLGAMRHPLQQYQVIIPPMPSQRIVASAFGHADNANEKRNLLLTAVDELRQICRQEASGHGLDCIEYDESIWSVDRVCMESKLIDHAHFMPDVYQNLVEKILQ
jgi:hypothetical protein